MDIPGNAHAVGAMRILMLACQAASMQVPECTDAFVRPRTQHYVSISRYMMKDSSANQNDPATSVQCPYNTYRNNGP